MNSKSIRLEIGLIGNNYFNLQIVTELLNHQGIIFKEISESGLDRKFPCIIISDNDSKDYELAKKHCLDTNNIIIASEHLPMDKVFLALAGVLHELYIENRLMTPVINQYELKLLEKIRSCYDKLSLPFVRKWFWPSFKEACFVMTHDVDLLVHHLLAPPQRKLNLRYIKYRWQNYKDPSIFYGSNIPEILSDEKKHGVKSTFYFLPNYDSSDQKSLTTLTGITREKLLEEIRAADCEIGLHGSMWSFQSNKTLENEKSILENSSQTKIKGIRQHFLNFLVPHTWRYQEKAGFEYDTTFSYNDAYGFRSGICFPYHAFDILTKKKFNLLELPMSFMDATSSFNKLSGDEILETLTKLRNTVERYNGVLVHNFHSGINNKETYPDHERAYIDSLDYMGKRNNYWIATAGECATWWRKREDAKIEIEYTHESIKYCTSTKLPMTIEWKGSIRKVEPDNGITLIQ